MWFGRTKQLITSINNLAQAFSNIDRMKYIISKNIEYQIRVDSTWQIAYMKIKVFKIYVLVNHPLYIERME